MVLRAPTHKNTLAKGFLDVAKNAIDSDVGGSPVRSSGNTERSVRTRRVPKTPLRALVDLD